MTDQLEPPQAETPPPADPAELTRSEDGHTVTSPDKSLLAQLGMTKRMAMKTLAQGRSERYLNTKITARVHLVMQANSADEISKAQKTANKLSKDKTLDGRSRAACVVAVAQCGMSLARASEVAMSLARNLDAPEEEGEKPAVRPVQNNYYGFPPVAKPSNRRSAASASSGDGAIVDVTPETKAA